MMFKFLVISLLLTIVNGQAPVLPSYYNRQSPYPTSLYNPSSPGLYPQSSPSLQAALSYQQEQNLQRQQALAAYQQQAQQATFPAQPTYLQSNRPSFTSSPSVNYSPSGQGIPRVSYQPQTAPVLPPQAVPTTESQQTAGISYANQPQTSYNPQGLQTISYQPTNEQPVAPAVTNYETQPSYDSQPNYNSQPNYDAEQIAALQRQREAQLAIERQRQNELALQKQREAERSAAAERQREYELNIRRQKEAEIAIERQRQAALAAQAQRDAIAAAQRAAQQAAQQQAAQQQAAQQQAAQQQAAQQAAQQQAAQQQAAQQQAAQQQAAQQAAQLAAQRAAQSQAYNLPQQPQAYNSQPSQSYNPPSQQPSYSYQPPARPVAQPTTTEAPKVVHRPAEIFYSKIGEQLNGDYTFGYHTGKGENDNSFREEKRLPDGTVTGAYGYVDKNGKKHVVKYTAGKDGFKVEGDVDPNISAASYNAGKLPPVESTTSKPAPNYQPTQVYQPAPAPAYRPPVSQPISQPTATYQPTTASVSASYNRPIQSTSSSTTSEAFEIARAQVAANRDKPMASTSYQAPIASAYQAPLRQNLGQNLSYRPPVRAANSQQPIGTHLATSASSVPVQTVRSRAVRKLLQTRHRQQPVTAIDTSASAISSSVVSEPVKLKTSSSVQILTHPPPPVPNYQPIDPSVVRMARLRTVKALTNSANIETSASSAKLSYSNEPIRKSVQEQSEVQSSPNKIESRSDNVDISESSDKLESRSDNFESRNSQSNIIDFPSIAMNSFLSRIK